MNLHILEKEAQDFINKNLNSDITKLILKGSPFKNISINELVTQIETKKKALTKIPTWTNTPNIYYPNKLNLEQTSSEATARYKSTCISGDAIIDITGGFGIDCYYFANQFKTVTHCELNEELSDIVLHNYKVLQQKNIYTYKGNGLEYIINNSKNYDWIYVDPSRRNDVKGKVFLLQDCLPNVPEHIDQLLAKSNNILLKNSPLLDITSSINELKNVKKISVVALKNEVKEVLVHIEKGYTENIAIETTNITTQNTLQQFNFEYKKSYNFETSEPLQYLYEPNSAILKAGGFYALSEILALFKLHQHSHLYTSNSIIDFPGRSFIVNEVLPYKKKEILKKLPHKKANITTRNFKENVATIRKKTGIKEGGTIYLFFTTNNKEEQIVLLCTKV